MAHFNLREFDAAIADFEAAYRLRPDPVFLFNLGQAHRLAEHPEPALYFYRAFLRNSPNAPNQREVEGRIATLDKLVAEKREAARPPDHTMEPKREPTATEPATPPPAATAAPAGVAAAPARALSAPGAKPAARPLHRRWWLWTAVGGAVAVGLAVGLGVGLTRGPGFDANLGTVGPALTARF